ncbi:phosphate ABC transporter permease subunit PstC [Sporosarcina aquimarina]|uniref:Phosphate transport system permease protein n=1 Tax=Sporosarcina aquimarina TaxID=114975 RepID=A0ABU4FZ88_9BACL|nr:phosphate ABC transporter permease subunit PstC [Sporosarcina aquimarina]MDW0110044.1 phosphate ABC transporter permease subunit PstC [Sporosarcina aquimarina]
MPPASQVSSSSEIRALIRHNQSQKTFRKSLESWIPRVLFLLAFLSVLTTVGIVVILLTETIEFFKAVPLIDFFTGTVLKPLSQTPAFGILPLVMGTLVSSGIALLVAGPIGLMAAIYLSEYASRRVRSVLKPALELLAGIPTIVYGFFAFTFVTPLLREWVPSLEATNILSPGLVMGIMIIPMIASLSEDAMRAVPEVMREGSAALGSTKLETSLNVVVPAALSGIIASFVLGISRALGETMIVAIASGSSKNFSFDLTESMQTMTAYIVEVTSGDAAAGSTVYYSLYAVAMTLFALTLIMNLIAGKIARKFREVY